MVVGAGILGATSAYHLKREYPEKEILLIEKNSAPGQESTVRSAGGIRNVYTSNTNFLLADTTVEMYKHIQYDLSYDLGLELQGYYWFLTERKYKEIEGIAEELKHKGVELKFLDRDEIKQITPDAVLDFDGDKEAERLGIENIYGGLIAPRAGYIDVNELVKFYEESFKELGGKTMYNTRITELVVEPKRRLGVPGEPLPWQDIKITGVKSVTHDIYGDVVLTVGAWAPLLLDPVGIDCLFKPMTRCTGFVLRPPKFDQLIQRMQFSFLFAPPKLRVTLQRAEGYFTAAVLSETWPLGYPYGLEEYPMLRGKLRDYESTVYRFLTKYFPLFKGIKPIDIKKPGLYQVNSIDGNPWVFKTAGMIYAGGQSGSGVHKSDALGRIVAALYGDREYAELYGGKKFKVSDLSVEKRNVEKEYFVF